MDRVRILGGAGLAAAALSAAAGFLNLPLLLGVSGALMLAGNLVALLGERGPR